MRDKNRQSRFFGADGNAAKEAFIRRYTPVLIRYFSRKGVQAATAEDLANEVFAQLLTRAVNAPLANREAYLMRAAANVWKDHLRARCVRRDGEHIAYEESEHAPVDFSPARVYEGKEGVLRLIAALKELPPRTQEVFVRCRIEGEKQKALARRLGISVSAVEKHLVRALAHIASNREADEGET